MKRYITDVDTVTITLTLSQWMDVSELCVGALTNGRNGRLLTDAETEAACLLLEEIGKWQDNFAVDGDSARNELCAIQMPEGLPFEIVGAHDAE